MLSTVVLQNGLKVNAVQLYAVTVYHLERAVLYTEMFLCMGQLGQRTRNLCAGRP